MARLPGNLPVLTREQAALRVIGSGAAFPFAFSASGGFQSVEVVNGLAKINQSIHTILATRRGERVMRPTFGCFAEGTEILLQYGTMAIEKLVGKRTLAVGVEWNEGNAHNPPHMGVRRVEFKNGAVFHGEQPIVTVKLSNGKEIRCTPDHKFLTAHGDYVSVKNLVERAILWYYPTPDMIGRVVSSQKAGTQFFGRVETGMFKLFVSKVEDKGEVAPVYDLVNSPTHNYILATGAVVSNSNLHLLLFDPNDEATWNRLKFEVADTLKTWEKRIRITSVIPVTPRGISEADLKQIPGYNQDLATDLLDPNTIGIVVNYIVLQTNVQGSYVYPFSLNGQPLADNLSFVFGGQ